MATSTPIRALAQQLDADLREAYAPDDSTGAPSASAAHLREAFSRFGREAAVAGVSLEDAMAASVDALQALFERVGGQMNDAGTVLSAGVALAAVARNYATAETSPTGQNGVPPMPTQLSRLAALHRVNRAVTAHLELSEMLETTVRTVKETTASDGCSVFLYDDATDSLALRAAVGLNPASIGAVTIRPGTGAVGRAAADRQPEIWSNTQSMDGRINEPNTGHEIYSSLLAVPMLLQGKNALIGVLSIFSVEPRHYEPEEITFLQAVASELAISIENARLYSLTDAELRRKIAELGTLQRVSRTVASTLDLNEVLRLIAEQAVELMNAEAAAIFRMTPLGPDGSKNRPVAETTPTIQYFAGDEREVIDDSRNRLVREVMATGSSRAMDISYADGTGTLFCLPLRSAREMYGALCIRMKPGTELTEDELGLLQAFTDSASLAIENAQLYEDAKRSLETVSALLQEMHHRVRNNLQTVAALLSLQARSAGDAEWVPILREAISRIQAIAAVHDLLSDEQRLGGTTVDVIAKHVADEAHTTTIPPDLHVEFEILPNDVKVPSKQATVLALIINELITNAVHHGFEGRKKGRISIRAWQQGGIVTLEVANNGRTVPEGFQPSQSRGLGMKIISRLVQSDLHGDFSLSSPGESGTIARITFPLATESEADAPGLAVTTPATLPAHTVEATRRDSGEPAAAARAAVQNKE